MDLNTKKAFTLVELIVVITILAILGTIAFISLQGYSASSRDSVRISDVSNMKTSLELFHLNAGKYPLPDNAEEITYGSDILWYQGTFGSTVVSQLSRNMSEIPTDSLSDKEYIYSVVNNKNEFQILNLLEGDIALNTTTQTNAAGTSIRLPRLEGQYNGVFLKTAGYIVPIPSIITAENITGGLILNNTNIKSQIITGGKNIPNIGNVNSAKEQLEGLILSVFTGTILKTDNDTKKVEVMKAIQGAYSGSILASEDIYKYILSKTTTDDLVALIDSVVLNNTSGGTSSNIIPEEVVVNLNSNDDFTKLLVHSDTTNGSTIFIDSSNSIHTITNYGEINHSTTTSEFGATSMYFNGIGDYFSMPYSDDWAFGTGDFTIDFWANLLSYTGDPYSRRYIVFGINTENAIQILNSDLNKKVSVFWGNTSRINSTTTTDTGWMHIALIRKSGVMKLFINGNQEGGDLVDNTDFISSTIQIGRMVGANGYFHGYLDEIRISKGIARWTENFTPPTAPYGN